MAKKDKFSFKAPYLERAIELSMLVSDDIIDFHNDAMLPLLDELIAPFMSAYNGLTNTEKEQLQTNLRQRLDRESLECAFNEQLLFRRLDEILQDEPNTLAKYLAYISFATLRDKSLLQEHPQLTEGEAASLKWLYLSYCEAATDKRSIPIADALQILPSGGEPKNSEYIARITSDYIRPDTKVFKMIPRLRPNTPYHNQISAKSGPPRHIDVILKPSPLLRENITLNDFDWIVYGAICTLCMPDRFDERHPALLQLAEIGHGRDIIRIKDIIRVCSNTRENQKDGVEYSSKRQKKNDFSHQMIERVMTSLYKLRSFDLCADLSEYEYKSGVEKLAGMPFNQIRVPLLSWDDSARTARGGDYYIRLTRAPILLEHAFTKTVEELITLNSDMLEIPDLSDTSISWVIKFDIAATISLHTKKRKSKTAASFNHIRLTGDTGLYAKVQALDGGTELTHDGKKIVRSVVKRVLDQMKSVGYIKSYSEVLSGKREIEMYDFTI